LLQPLQRRSAHAPPVAIATIATRKYGAARHKHNMLSFALGSMLKAACVFLLITQRNITEMY
jgi:hypothetical protein